MTNNQVLDWTGRILPFLGVLACFSVCLGICWSIWLFPSDFQQGENARILSIHVPCACLSLGSYVLLTASSILYLSTRHPLCRICAEVCSRVGVFWTLLTLLSGSLWGKPMWGTYWVWDARLTSVFLLLLIYLGILRLHQMGWYEMACLTSCLGLLNIPIIKYSVYWWATLHQSSSWTEFGTAIHWSLFLPTVCMGWSLILCSFYLFLLEIRLQILWILHSAYPAYARNGFVKQFCVEEN